MALFQAAGTTIGVSATLASTHDAVGFEALTFASVGQIEGAPDLDGTFDTASFTNLETGEEEKFPDVLRAGSGSFQVGLDEGDAGQTAMEGQKGKKAAFAFTLANGSIYYRNAIVTSFKPTNITVGGVVMADIALEFEKTTVKTTV
jgi:hypothetical protein